MLHQPRTARSDLIRALSRDIKNLKETMVMRSSDENLFNPCSGGDGKLHGSGCLDQQASVMTSNLKRLIANAEKARSSPAAIPSLVPLEDHVLNLLKFNRKCSRTRLALWISSMQSYNSRPATITYLQKRELFAHILKFGVIVRVLTGLCSYESRIIDFASVSESLVMRKKAKSNER